MVQLNFNAAEVEPFEGFAAVPAGWYNVMMDESEMKPTKDGSGAYLHCRLAILDGQYKGQKLFTRFNLRNQNPVAVEIAYKQLSAVARAVGILQVQDSSQLHNRPLKVKVKVRKDQSGQYEDSNEITSYKNINENVGEAPAFAAPNQFTPPPVQQFAPPAQAYTAQQYAMPAAQQYAPLAQQPAFAPPAQQWVATPAAPQYAPPAAPNVDPAQQTWQQPAAQQPWQTPAVQPDMTVALSQAPTQQPQEAQVAAPVQQQVTEGPHPAQGETPPWMK